MILLRDVNLKIYKKEGAVEQFTINSSGHYMITVTGNGLSGEQQLNAINKQKIQIISRQVLLNPDYNKQILSKGEQCTLIIIPTRNFSGHTQKEIDKFVENQWGYKKSIASVIFPLLENGETPVLMENMGVRYIASTGIPIADSAVLPNVLGLSIPSKTSKVVLLDAFYATPDRRWDNKGALIYIAPQ